MSMLNVEMSADWVVTSTNLNAMTSGLQKSGSSPKVERRNLDLV